MLLGGLPADGRGKVVIIGAGQAGGNATRMAAAFGSQVTVFERKRERMQQIRAIGDNVTAIYPFDASISEALTATLIPYYVNWFLQTGVTIPFCRRRSMCVMGSC